MSDFVLIMVAALVIVALCFFDMLIMPILRRRTLRERMKEGTVLMPDRRLPSYMPVWWPLVTGIVIGWVNLKVTHSTFLWFVIGFDIAVALVNYAFVRSAREERRRFFNRLDAYLSEPEYPSISWMDGDRWDPNNDMSGE